MTIITPFVAALERVTARLARAGAGRTGAPRPGVGAGQGRRIGLLHAAGTLSALALYGASLAARRRRSDACGTVLALGGATIITASSYLGGHMSYTRGVGPNQTAFDPGAREWVVVAEADDLPRGRAIGVLAAGTPVLLLCDAGGALHAIHDRCSHRGCRLHDGDIAGHVVTCPCHGSRDDVRDGAVLRGPTAFSQPVFDVRESGGQVAVRLRRRSRP